ncbi:hypothetical protein BpHYR1_035211 [Brachionus plicatilis]|uniref:Uncharacterized protein n=1 Tax=Brachionus plicatilis TaxID=10195 RepID=A0A3M7T9N1_BRAPC|nr:hypothetical protein BpHYR1_035211 [Brachionus plicatilis]
MKNLYKSESIFIFIKDLARPRTFCLRDIDSQFLILYFEKLKSSISRFQDYLIKLRANLILRRRLFICQKIKLMTLLRS